MSEVNELVFLSFPAVIFNLPTIPFTKQADFPTWIATVFVRFRKWFTAFDTVFRASGVAKEFDAGSFELIEPV